MRREMMWFRWNFYDERKFNSTRKLGIRILGLK